MGLRTSSGLCGFSVAAFFMPVMLIGTLFVDLPWTFDIFTGFSVGCHNTRERACQVLDTNFKQVPFHRSGTWTVSIILSWNTSPSCSSSSREYLIFVNGIFLGTQPSREGLQLDTALACHAQDRQDVCGQNSYVWLSFTQCIQMMMKSLLHHIWLTKIS